MEAMHAAAAGAGAAVAAPAGAAAAAAGGLGGAASPWCSWVRLLLLFWLGVCLLSTLYAAAALRWVRAAAAGWEKLTREQQQQYGAFERYDWHALSTPKILLGAFFLAPIRFVVLIGLLAMHNACSRILAFHYGLGTKTSSCEDFAKRRAAFAGISRFFCGLFLKVFGITRTQNVFWDGKNRQGPDAFECKNIVSNHVSCMDIMYFMTQAYTAFICKASIRKTPFISWPARFLRCIFVDRDSEQDRRKALEALVERMKKGGSDPTCNPIVVFPEGTTTNGRCLITFRRGAFAALQPLQPCVLIYTPGCMHPAYELIPSPYFMSLSLSAWPAAELRAYWLQPMQPPPADGFSSEEKRVEAFAKEVRTAMWQVLKRHHYDPAKFEGPECPDVWDANRCIRQACIDHLLHLKTVQTETKKAL